MFDLKELLQTTSEFMDRNASKILQSEDFLVLSSDALVKLISRNSFCSDEMNIFKGTVNLDTLFLCYPASNNFSLEFQNSVLPKIYFWLQRQFSRYSSICLKISSVWAQFSHWLAVILKTFFWKINWTWVNTGYYSSMNKHNFLICTRFLIRECFSIQ